MSDGLHSAIEGTGGEETGGEDAGGESSSTGQWTAATISTHIPLSHIAVVVLRHTPVVSQQNSS